MQQTSSDDPDPHHNHPCCHLDWPMLCREQRTALTTARHRSQCRRDRHQVVQTLASDDGFYPCDGSTQSPLNQSHSCFLSSASPLLLPENSISVNRTVIERTRSNRRKYYPKFGEVFAWVCLISLVQSSLAAPQRSHVAIRSMDSTFGVEPIWINPCGGASSDYSAPQDEGRTSDKELFNTIVIQAKTALNEAERYKGDYVMDTFKLGFENHHSSWKLHRYDWLPAIPKELGQSVPESHLKILQEDINTALADIYNYLQRFAVGLEQIDHDQQKHNGSFKDLFNAAKYKLMSVLCEIQVAIIERGSKRHDDISRDIMPDKLRIMDSDANRNVRDWIIYRDYINALQYTVEVFEYLKSKSQ